MLPPPTSPPPSTVPSLDADPSPHVGGTWWSSGRVAVAALAVVAVGVVAVVAVRSSSSDSTSTTTPTSSPATSSSADKVADTVVADPSVIGTLGPAGGTARSTDGITVTVPAGALTGDAAVSVTISRSLSAEQAGLVAVGPLVDISVAGVLSASATVTMPITDAAAFDPDVDPSGTPGGFRVVARRTRGI